MIPVIAISAVVALIGGYYYQTEVAPVKSIFDDLKFKENVNLSIYGQNYAMNTLYDALMSKHNDPGAHVILFIGGPGVGKTYTASILNSYYEPKDMIIHILPSVTLFNSSTLTAVKYKISRITKGFGLMIIDGAKFEDEDLQDFLVRLNKYCKGSNLVLKVIVIAEILKIHPTSIDSTSVSEFKTTDDYIKYLNSISWYYLKLYDAIGIDNCETVLFMPMNQDAVRKCILHAGKSQFKQLTEPEIEQILNHLVSIESKFAPSGCKDVFDSVGAASL